MSPYTEAQAYTVRDCQARPHVLGDLVCSWAPPSSLATPPAWSHSRARPAAQPSPTAPGMFSVPARREVLEAMHASLAGVPGNASSAHARGREASAALQRARGEVARLLGASPGEIVFTSGGTESDNLAILGLVRPGDHVITSAG